MQSDGSPIVRIVIALENPIYFFLKKIWINECIDLENPIKKKPEQMTVWEADIENEKD